MLCDLHGSGVGTGGGGGQGGTAPPPPAEIESLADVRTQFLSTIASCIRS